MKHGLRRSASATLLTAGLAACSYAQQAPPQSAKKEVVASQPADPKPAPTKPAPTQAAVAAKPAVTKPAPAKSNEEYKAFGSKSAPITLEVFSDYQCPACRQLYMDTLRPLIQNYATAGKVYVIHRDMPLTMHKYSRVAARYANAAARIGKLEKVSEAIYLTQEKWSVDGNIDGVVASVLTPAEMKRVRELVQGGTLEAGIDADVSLGGTHRVTSTPTLVITHRGEVNRVAGVFSYSILKQYLDDLLSKR